eukprot:14387650-Heterocapsa_arctica.AAC.1
MIAGRSSGRKPSGDVDCTSAAAEVTARCLLEAALTAATGRSKQSRRVGPPLHCRPEPTPYCQ